MYILLSFSVLVVFVVIRSRHRRRSFFIISSTIQLIVSFIVQFYFARTMFWFSVFHILFFSRLQPFDSSDNNMRTI